MNRRRLAGGVALGALAVDVAPAITAIGPLRRSFAPTLAGRGRAPHIALTFDDGPDPASTPAFLDLLARHERTATFFVLGRHARANAGLLQRMAAEGHELAVHGWSHRCTAAVPPTRLASGVAAARQTIEDITGIPVRWYRPPYGVLTAETLLACRAAALTPVLWTAWGRDWERSATPTRIVASVLKTLRPGGTILLHDTDRHSARDSWRRTLAATDQLLAGPLNNAELGPLQEHVTPPAQGGPTGDGPGIRFVFT